MVWRAQLCAVFELLFLTNTYYPYGSTISTLSSGTPTVPNDYKYNNKEMIDDLGLNMLDYGARLYDPLTGRWNGVDALAERYHSSSTYGYVGGNPVSRADINGKEWDYVVDENGHITINVSLNLVIAKEDYAIQLDAYKKAIAEQLNSSISKASGGTMSSAITFYDGNPNIIQTLTLNEMDIGIAGATSFFYSSVNLLNSKGEQKTLFDIGADAIHEMLHTLRVEHPFETTQAEDTKLLKIAPNYFESTSTTDANIVNNVMNYSSITINGQKGNNLTVLTKGQLDFIIDEIKLQKQGYGFKPKYNLALTPEQNGNLYNQYYENYWLYPPGTPVGNK